MARYAGRSRKGRRSSRSLSTRRIFNNKGAKAQARQIYALRKSIGRVARQCRPEVKLIRTTNENRAFGYDSTKQGSPNLINSLLAPIVLPLEGTADNQRVGNKITLKNVSFFLNSEYNHTNQIVNNVYPYIQNPLQSKGMVMRFVAVQTLAPVTNVYLSEIFANDYTAAGAQREDLMMMMTMPFKNGLTARFRILKDKRYYINEDKPILSKRISIKPVIRNLRWEDGMPYPRGMIFYIMITAGGDLTYAPDQTTGTEFYNYNNLDTTWRHELSYTDA